MKYQQNVAAPNFVKDEFVTRSRHHAFNRGVSAFFVVVVAAIVINYGAWRLFEKQFVVESLVVIVCWTLFMYGDALKVYTEQDRDIILSKYIKEEPALIEEPTKVEPFSLTERTELPHPSHNNGRLFVGVGLTNVQKEQIARIGLEKGSLPINTIEAVGLSRQKAELLRSELASLGLGYFTDKDRFELTTDGEKVFAKIVRKS